jgi:hypothetical protein
MEQSAKTDESVEPEPIKIRKLDKIETTGHRSNPSGN